MREVWRTGQVVLGVYQIGEQVGAGGMGVVHKVRHLGWNEDLAVKSPRPGLFAAGAAAFVDEAEVWVGLPSHPHLCSCHYVRVLDGVPRIFAEFVEGGTVAEALRAGGLRAVGDVVDVAIQMAWGLRAAHEAGVVHQDVKPSNALVTSDGLVKVTDFGLAKAQQRAGGGDLPDGNGVESILATHRGLTPAYASPEQTNRQPAGRRGDVWSWAVSVLELFTGEVIWRAGPLAGEALEAYLARGPSPGRPAMPGSVAELLRECFTIDPARRPADLGVLAGRLIELYRTCVGTPYPRETPDAVASLADAHNNRALSLLDLGRTEQSEESWRQALLADPHHVDATFNWRLAQWRAGQITDIELVEQLERFRFSRPPTGTGRDRMAHLLGMVHLERGDAPAADKAFREAGEAAALAPAPHPPLHLTGHDGHLLALSADGRTAISGGEDGTVCWWDLTTGGCIASMTGHDGPVSAAALAPGDRYAVSGGADGTVRWWDLIAGSCLRVLSGRDGSTLRSVAVSPDGLRVVTGDDAGIVGWWDLATGRCMVSMTGHDGPVNRVALLRDARQALSAGEDGTLRWWDLTSGRCLRTSHDHDGAVSSLAVLPDETGFLSCGIDGTVREWDLATGRCVQVLTYRHRVFDVLSPSIHLVAVSPDGKTAVAGDRHGDVTWWDLGAGRCLRTFVGPADAVTVLAVSVDGGTAISGGSGMDVLRWDLAMGSPAPWSYSRPRSTVELGAHTKEFQGRLGAARSLLDRGDVLNAATELRRARAIAGFEHNSTLGELWRRCGPAGRRTTVLGSRQTRRLEAPSHLAKTVAITAGARNTLAACGDGIMRWWDLATGKCLRTFDDHDGSILAVAVTPDGRRGISVDGSALRWWELARGRCLRVMPMPSSMPVFSAVITPDGRRALSGDAEGLVRWWDLTSGRCLRTLDHGGGINSVAVTADGHHALSGGGDRVLSLWDLTTGECLHAFADHASAVSAVAVTPGGRRAVTGTTDGIVRGWDLGTREGLPVGTGHSADITAVAITADGRHALSGGEDGTLRWWDLDSGRCLHQVKTTYVASAAMTPDAQHTISGMADGSVLLWEVDWDYDFHDH